MEQNSAEWKEWRNQGLGSSDAPVIMGVSPYKTPFQLWQEKLGYRDDDAYNAAMMAGHEWEPKIRKMVEDKTGIVFPPYQKEKESKRYLRASFDGINLDKRLVLEIKYANEKDHETAKSGNIPDKYYPQIQHQLNVINFDNGVYASFNENQNDLAIVEYKKDTNYVNNLELKMDEFWQLVLTKTPPDLTNKDFINIDDTSLLSLAEDYESVTNTIKKLKEKQELVRKELIDRLPHEACVLGGLKVQKVFSKGRIDYASIPELSAMDLDQYRKPMSVSWRFTSDS
jgi:putative phage-type endonuclease